MNGSEPIVGGGFTNLTSTIFPKQTNKKFLIHRTIKKNENCFNNPC